MVDGGTLALLITGAAVGVLGGLLGIGGAVVLAPTLVFVFGFSQHRAQGTSLAALIPPIGIFAVLRYYKAGFVDVRVAALVAVAFVFGALGGASVVPYVPQVWLRRAFATLLVYVAAQLMFADPSRKAGAVLPGVVAIGALWIVYAARRLLGQKPARPTREVRPQIDYFI
jgi:hypothetical protein